MRILAEVFDAYFADLHDFASNEHRICHLKQVLNCIGNENSNKWREIKASKVSEVPAMVKFKIFHYHYSGKKTGGNEQSESKASSSGGLSSWSHFNLFHGQKPERQIRAFEKDLGINATKRRLSDRRGKWLFSDEEVFVSDRASRLRTKGREKGLHRISNKKKGKKSPSHHHRNGLRSWDEAHSTC
ncbi:hypothetical protein Salat_2580500 [Sesamum alatum]|uniref:Uncharacterized protein n=1 Tax=Sesamum alatum TaxID=300844 RepID=A0AAE1XNS9_9LAMI|nr:hypothetical protein Salat_2580500 [Sesamum alatum]